MASSRLGVGKTTLSTLGLFLLVQFIVFALFYIGARSKLSRLSANYLPQALRIGGDTDDPTAHLKPTGEASSWGFSPADIFVTPPGERGRRYNVSVAIGLGVSTRQLVVPENQTAVDGMLFFTSLLPSFCDTASGGYDYHVYIAYDLDDKHLNATEFRARVGARFLAVTATRCPPSAAFALHLIRCSHSGRPAWAQNDAMMAAYLDGRDYFYRVNDDTVMLTPHWTPAFIKALNEYDPPLVGVVGPDHRGGWDVILTYDFVHRTHIDIFGFYYPRCYTDWYADGWITGVYAPGRVDKLKEVVLEHTLSSGTRYDIHILKVDVRERKIARDRNLVIRYVTSLERRLPSTAAANGSKVVAMSLVANDAEITWGAIRNAQLMPVFYQDWTLRIYVASDMRPPVHPSVLATLRRLGAQIDDTTETDALPGELRHLLVADDPHVDYFAVRSPLHRFGARDAAALRAWLRSNMTLHCMRDHPNVTHHVIPAELWAAVSRRLRDRLQIPMQSLLKEYHASTQPVGNWSTEFQREKLFLDKYIWPKVQYDMFCHDSLNCTKTRDRDVFPKAHMDLAYVGMRVTPDEEPAWDVSPAVAGILKARCRQTIPSFTRGQWAKKRSGH